MNKSEFKQRAYANPYDRDTDFIRVVENNEAYTRWLKELQEFDAILTDAALQITVPSDLVEAIKVRRKKEPRTRVAGFSLYFVAVFEDCCKQGKDSIFGSGSLQLIDSTMFPNEFVSREFEELMTNERTGG